MKSIILAVVLVFLCPSLNSGQEEKCQPSIVHWKDATLHTKIRGGIPKDLDKLTVDIQTVGCVVQAKKTIVVFLSFVDGEPDIVLAIPKDWAVKIEPLRNGGTQ